MPTNAPSIQGPAVLVVLGVIVLLAAGYLFFAKDSATEGVVRSTKQPGSVAEASFLALTSKIEPVTFDTDILSDPRFLVLQDMITAVANESAGKINPFMPF